MSDDRHPCRVCGRLFNPESLTRHERVCQKVVTKKPRKVFDSGRQRATGSDVPYNKTMKPAPSYAPPPPAYAPKDASRFGYKGGQGGGSMGSMGAQGARKSNWRKQHEDFIAAVRAAKAYDKAVKTGGPLPPPAPPSENPDFVQCPTCGRRFNENAAARHIPFCAEQSNRVASKRIPDAAAQKRAQARGYQAPVVGKPKSTSGGGGRGNLMGTQTLSGANDYGYDSYAAAPPNKYGMSQPARRPGPSGGNGSGGAGGRYAASNRQVMDDSEFESYAMPVQGPRGSRLGGGVPARQPAPNSRLGPSGGGRGSPLGGSSAFGSRGQLGPGGAGNQQAVYLGSNPSGGPARGVRQPGAGMNGGYADYDSIPVAAPKSVSSRGGNLRAGGVAETGSFCYECGNQYPSKTAKFCVECGVKRM